MLELFKVAPEWCVLWLAYFVPVWKASISGEPCATLRCPATYHRIFLGTEQAPNTYPFKSRSHPRTALSRRGKMRSSEDGANHAKVKVGKN